MIKKLLRKSGLTLLFLVSPIILAGNPIIYDVGMADPHIYIFKDKAYLYTTRDINPDAEKFQMVGWNIHSSDDLVNWKFERTIKPSETYMGAGSIDCWASETVFRNGKYYFYFSDRNRSTGVMVADDPAGPFVEAYARPMLGPELSPTNEYDPSVQKVGDDYYMIWGKHFEPKNEFYHIAKLDKSMVRLANRSRGEKVVLRNVGYTKNDKPTLHFHNGRYYLSAGSYYGTSKSVFGPYNWGGNSGLSSLGDGRKYGLKGSAHGNYFKWRGQWFHTWTHFHLGKDRKYRESYITYLHYKDDGTMVDDVAFLDAHFATGVGQYDASWDRIEAEWYMGASGVEKKDGRNGGFAIKRITDNGFLNFPNVKRMPANAKLTFRVSSANRGRIEVRQGSPRGHLLGSCNVENTGGWNNFKNVRCQLQNSAGNKNLYFVFRGAQNTFLMDLDWWRVDTIGPNISLDAKQFLVNFDAESNTADDTKIRKNVTLVDNIRNGNWIRFDNFNFGQGIRGVKLKYATPKSGTLIEFRLGSPNGRLAASANLASTGSFSKFEKTYASSNSVTGINDLFLVFKGGDGGLVNLRWFKVLSQ